MIILAIETSCDDTCVSVIKAKGGCFDILSNVVSSQVKLHANYGGVYPSLAKREHQKNLVPVLKSALAEAKLLKKSKCQNPNAKSSSKLKCQKLKGILAREEILYKQLKIFLSKYQKAKIDAIAVTIGPGLEPCLWVGVNFAKALAFWWNLPIIPVNHIEAHIFANFISENEKLKIKNEKWQCKIKNLLPTICLVASGGHTQLILMQDLGRYRILGETRDDAAGECFDKTARLLGLPYPGGPAIAAEAAKFKVKPARIGYAESAAGGSSKFKVTLPRPMIHSRDYDFSFSGLKTAVLYDFQKRPAARKKSRQYIAEMAKEIQQSVIDVLITKTIKAAKDYRAKSIILAGGVASNHELRQQFKVQSAKCKVNFLVPKERLCTDNAAMVAVAGYCHFEERTMEWEKVGANANLRIDEITKLQ